MYSRELVEGSLEERALRIRGKLAQLRQGGWQRFADLPGIASHRFDTHPGARADAIERFENYHEVTLPPAYACFLTHVGDGGAGPFHGLLPLERDVALSLEEVPPPELLSEECRLHPGMAGDEDWEVQLPPGLSEPYGGILALAEQGGPFYCGLVLNGPYRGRVVYVDLDMQPPYFTDAPDFLAWYERWLDDLLEDTDVSWFGFTPTGDEEELRGLLVHPDPVLRAGGAAGLGKRSGAGAATLEALAEARRDPEPDVRAAALSSLGNLAGEGALPLLADGLTDPSPEVRRTAVLTLRDLGTPASAVALRAALWDRNGLVVRAAIFSLVDRQLPFEDALRPLLEDPREEVRATAAAVLGVTPRR